MGDALPHTTLIIVVVCAVLAAVLVLVLAANLIRTRLARRPRAPLPPVQPLAHHRAPKYDTLDSRPPSSIPDDPPIPTLSFNSFDSTLPHPPRPVSNASLSSLPNISRPTSRTTLRGVPHAPHSNVQIVLPTPLSPSLPRPHPIRRDTDSDRISFVDKWVPVGRDNTTSASPRSSRRVPSSTSLSTSPSSYSYFQPQSPPPPVPQLPPDTRAP